MPSNPSKSASKQKVDPVEKEALYTIAAALYQDELEKPVGIRKGLCKICEEVSDEHFAHTKNRITLSKSTLSDRANGLRSRLESNASRSWVTPEEAEQLINYSLEMAQRGFPLSRRQLRDHANTILRARLGDLFPEGGVGKHWVERFIAKHSDRVHLFRSRPLDKKRAAAVNPTTCEAWFTLLGDYMKKHDFAPGCIYGSDETGFQLGGFFRKHVLGPTGEKTVKEVVGDGSREQMTVLVTICADGMTIAPLVISKVQHISANGERVTR